MSTLTITSAGAVDGFVTDTMFVDASNPIAVGDTDGSFMNVSRGFLRFSLAGVPSGAVILSAELRVFQSAITGDPYATHGVVHVDHVDIGGSLDASDFASAALQSGFGTLSTDGSLELKVLDVTTQVQADLAATRINSDFRLRFTTASDMDGVDDYTEFNDGEDSQGTGTVPTLIVRFQLP